MRKGNRPHITSIIYEYRVNIPEVVMNDRVKITTVKGVFIFLFNNRQQREAHIRDT